MKSNRRREKKKVSEKNGQLRFCPPPQVAHANRLEQKVSENNGQLHIHRSLPDQKERKRERNVNENNGHPGKPSGPKGEACKPPGPKPSFLDPRTTFCTVT